MISELLIKLIPTSKESFSLFLTDGAAYCLKAGKILKHLFRGVTHVTCISHVMHLSIDKARKCPEGADKCIATLKAALTKSGERRSTYPIIFRPWPIVTRLGTWVKCGIYIAKIGNRYTLGL